SMPDELARAWAFLERGDMGGEPCESTVGTAYYDEQIPLRLDSNFLRVERPAPPADVLAQAERLGRRMVVVPDASHGEELAPFFAERGWLVRRHVLMAQHRAPDRTADLSRVEEVEEAELRPPRQRVVAPEP